MKQLMYVNLERDTPAEIHRRLLLAAKGLPETPETDKDEVIVLDADLTPPAG